MTIGQVGLAPYMPTYNFILILMEINYWKFGENQFIIQKDIQHLLKPWMQLNLSNYCPSKDIRIYK